MFHVPAHIVYLTVLGGLNDESLMNGRAQDLYIGKKKGSWLHSVFRVTKNSAYVYIYIVCNSDLF